MNNNLKERTLYGYRTRSYYSFIFLSLVGGTGSQKLSIQTTISIYYKLFCVHVTSVGHITN